jgi:hypothetical protein
MPSQYWGRGKSPPGDVAKRSISCEENRNRDKQKLHATLLHEPYNLIGQKFVDVQLWQAALKETLQCAAIPQRPDLMLREADYVRRPRHPCAHGKQTQEETALAGTGNTADGVHMLGWRGTLLISAERL